MWKIICHWKLCEYDFITAYTRLLNLFSFSLIILMVFNFRILDTVKINLHGMIYIYIYVHNYMSVYDCVKILKWRNYLELDRGLSEDNNTKQINFYNSFIGLCHNESSQSFNCPNYIFFIFPEIKVAKSYSF